MVELEKDTIGSYLKNNRLAKGVSLEEIASETKINVNILYSLENDDFSELPAAPFVRGFIRAYTKYTGLDSKRAIMLYETSNPLFSDRQNEPVDLLADRDGIKLEASTRKYTIHGLVIGVVLLTFGITLLIVKLTDSTKNIKQKLADNKIEKTMIVNMNVPAAVAVLSKEEKREKEKVLETEVKPVETPVEKHSDEIPFVAPQAQVTAVKTIQDIFVTARSLSWIKVQLDDNAPYDFMLEQGATKQLKGATVKILLGNAGAIDVKYNGKNLHSLGAEGVVRTVVFPGLGRWKDAQVQ